MNNNYEIFVSQNFEEMKNRGFKGILCFWLRIFLILVPIVNAVFSIYILAINSAKIWIKAVGGGILAISIFLFLCSLASSIFMILSWLKIKIGSTTNLTFPIATIISIVSLVIECCLLSQITNSRCELLYQDLYDYCILNYDDPTVYKFLVKHSSFYCMRRYVQIRTTDNYGATATFLAIWIILLAMHFLVLYLLSTTTEQTNVDQDIPPSPDQLHDLPPT